MLSRPSWMLLVVAAACTRNVPGTTPPPGGASQKLDIASSGHLLVSASVDGRPYVLILDTGANITSLSTQAARELGIETSGSIEINNSVVASTGTVRTLAISGVDHENLPVAIVDIPDALASGAEGILGLDVLARHDIVVDFAGEEFGIYPAGMLANSRRELVKLDYGANGLILLNVAIDDRTTVLAVAAGEHPRAKADLVEHERERAAALAAAPAVDEGRPVLALAGHLALEVARDVGGHQCGAALAGIEGRLLLVQGADLGAFDIGQRGPVDGTRQMVLRELAFGAHIDQLVKVGELCYGYQRRFACTARRRPGFHASRHSR
jgi:hypothetical protein